MLSREDLRDVTHSMKKHWTLFVVLVKYRFAVDRFAPALTTRRRYGSMVSQKSVWPSYQRKRAILGNW